MKTITLKEAHQILKQSSAVIIDNGIVLFSHVSDLVDDDLNEFLQYEWRDDEGLEYNLVFCEGDNQEVKVSGSFMYLIDTDNGVEETQLTILTTKQL